MSSSRAQSRQRETSRDASGSSGLPSQTGSRCETTVAGAPHSQRPSSRASTVARSLCHAWPRLRRCVAQPPRPTAGSGQPGTEQTVRALTCAVTPASATCPCCRSDGASPTRARTASSGTLSGLESWRAFHVETGAGRLTARAVLDGYRADADSGWTKCTRPYAQSPRRRSIRSTTRAITRRSDSSARAAGRDWSQASSPAIPSLARRQSAASRVSARNAAAFVCRRCSPSSTASGSPASASCGRLV